jgi:hypothetical protein
MGQALTVEILHSGGLYPRLVAEYLQSRGGSVLSYAIEADPLQASEEAERQLPAGIGRAEVMIAIALPAGLLTALPRVLAGTRCRAFLVPIEDPAWVRPGLAMQLARLCREMGLESATPMPFCQLSPTGEVIGQFCRDYALGRPSFQMAVADGKVTECRCVRGSPCGLTHWLADQLAGVPVEEAVERAKTLHHARPCLASMALVPELGETLMHVSMDMVQKAVANALRRALGGSVLSHAP